MSTPTGDPATVQESSEPSAVSAGTRIGERSGNEQAIDAQIAYDERGLVPCVIQDWHSGEVLTMAYMNELALARTRATGELHLWSRSRNELWRKGETSGNTQTVRALRLDCDGDTLLALVEPAGPACHTGERTCFHRGELAPAPCRDWSARSQCAPASAPPAPTRSSCSRTRGASARR
jgi:phosphoribosyl-AMP cyclohydrolase